MPPCPTRRRPRASRPALALAASLLLLGACASDSVLELEVGDCLRSADLGAAEVVTVPVVECSAEHDGEVYAELVVDAETFPGAETLRADGDAFCRAEFAEFVGVDYDSSQIHFTTMYPTRDGWGLGDRTVLCIALAPEDVTGTLEGAGY